jgi:hypothetical protein
MTGRSTGLGSLLLRRCDLGYGDVWAMLSANNRCDVRHMMSHCLNCDDSDEAQNQSNIGHPRFTQPILEDLVVVGVEFVKRVLRRSLRFSVGGAAAC